MIEEPARWAMIARFSSRSSRLSLLKGSSSTLPSLAMMLP
jgi:hypothetical protein